MKTRAAWLTVVCLFVVSACGEDSSNDTDDSLRAVIEANALTGNPANGVELPSIDDPVAVLGRKLFFSKSLGGDRDSACVTCHHPSLGGGDGLPLSIGVGADDPDLLGPGRTHEDGDFTVPRNAPSTFNIGLFQTGLFWDGRVESLGADGIRTPDSDFGTPDGAAGVTIVEAQARFPVTSAEEMRGFEFALDQSNDELRLALAQRLVDDGQWQAEFEDAFGTNEITFARIAEAIGAYEASQVFIDTPWRAYIEGDSGALSDSAKRGALLFYRSNEEGGADCASCHSGDFFTNESFWAIASPQIWRGKGDGATETHDYGRERETGAESDRFTFRTPSLLNVAVQAPYLHAGAYDDLRDVIRLHLDPQGVTSSYDPNTVAGAANDGYEANRAEMLDFLEDSPKVIRYFREPFEHTEDQLADLISFLEALTDPCTENRECLAPWIGDPATDDVDGELLVAVDENGELL